MTKNQVAKRYGDLSSITIGTNLITVAKGIGDHFNFIIENEDGTFNSVMSFGSTWGQESLEHFGFLNFPYLFGIIERETFKSWIRNLV